jgi:hypothetical protein
MQFIFVMWHPHIKLKQMYLTPAWIAVDWVSFAKLRAASICSVQKQECSRAGTSLVTRHCGQESIHMCHESVHQVKGRKVSLSLHFSPKISYCLCTEAEERSGMCWPLPHPLELLASFSTLFHCTLARTVTRSVHAGAGNDSFWTSISSV